MRTSSRSYFDLTPCSGDGALLTGAAWAEVSSFSLSGGGEWSKALAKKTIPTTPPSIEMNQNSFRLATTEMATTAMAMWNRVAAPSNVS